MACQEWCAVSLWVTAIIEVALQLFDGQHPCGGVRRTAGCSQIKKAKKKKKKAIGLATKIKTRVTWDQEPVNSMVRKLLYAFDARFPNLSFFKLALQPRVHFFFCGPRVHFFFFFCSPRAAERVITRPHRPWLVPVKPTPLDAGT